jgi:hypothetical protein
MYTGQVTIENQNWGSVEKYDKKNIGKDKPFTHYLSYHIPEKLQSTTNRDTAVKSTRRTRKQPDKDNTHTDCIKFQMITVKRQKWKWPPPTAKQALCFTSQLRMY